MSKKIVLTGGGTAGHVTPHLALLPYLVKDGYEVFYIGSKNGIEKHLIRDQGLPYYEIETGKLRRYFDPKNFSDPFRVIRGLGEAHRILRKIKPDVIFSKGGYVSVPVVQAGAMLRIPSIIHESDMTPGLANKLCFRAAKKICCNFPETMNDLPSGKAVLTGTPIREELFSGSAERGFAFTGLANDKPVILVVGGSLGAQAVNEAVRAALPGLLENWSVVHLTGKGKLDASFEGTAGYRQYEYIKEELPDLFAMADLVISRAGANAICEIEALAKPNILIPLPAKASRGDQLLNAESFKKQGFSVVLKEESVTPKVLIDAVNNLYENRADYIKAMKESPQGDSAGVIMKLINNYRLHR